MITTAHCKWRRIDSLACGRATAVATPPVAVHDNIIGHTHSLDFIDRCHSLRSLCPFGVPDIFLADKSATSSVDPGTRLCPASTATGSARQRGRRRRRSHRSPPDTCQEPPFESVLNTKSPTPNGVGLFVVGEDGFEPSKRYAADLQSVPFGHSGTPPYSFF